MSRISNWFACALLVAGGPLFGQEGTKRTLSEEAAWAADYEGDYVKALRLYDAALSKERIMRTETSPEVVRLASERARIAALLGESKTPTPQDASARPAPSFERRAHELAASAHRSFVSRGSRSDIESEVRQRAALLGGELTPYLVKFLDGAPVEGVRENGEAAPVDSFVVARLLACIDDPRAAAALDAGRASRDPVVRVAVFRGLDPQKHRAWILEGLASQTPQIRDAAYDALSRAKPDDAAASELLLQGAKEGLILPGSWIASNRRNVAFAALADPSLTEKGRDVISMELMRSDATLTADELKALLQSAILGGKESEQRFAGHLVKLVDRRSAVDAVRDARSEIERWVIDRVGAVLPNHQGSTARAWAAVASLASIDKLEAIFNEGPFESPGLMGASQAPASQFGIVLDAIREAPDFDFVKLAEKLALTDDKVFASVEGTDPKLEWGRSAVADMLRHNVIRAPMSTYVEAAGRLSGVRRRFFLEFPAAELLGRSQGRPWFHGPSGVALALEILASCKGQKALQTAITVCGKYGRTKEAAAALVAFIQSDATEDLSGAASAALRHMASESRPQVSEVLERAIFAAKDEAAGNRLLSLLDVFSNEDVLRITKALWDRPRSTVRTAALQSALIRQEASDEALEFVVDRLSTDPIVEGYLRERLIRRIGKSLFQPAMPVLREALLDSHEPVRTTAQSVFELFKANRAALEELDAWMRADMQKGDAVAELVRLLDSEKVEVVVGAVRALGALKAKTALPKLVKLLERDQPELRTAIGEAITKIGE